MTKPAHYSISPDPLDIANLYDLDMATGNAIKYILRAGRKLLPGDTKAVAELRDIRKAIDCLTRKVEWLEAIVAEEREATEPDWESMSINEELRQAAHAGTMASRIIRSGDRRPSTILWAGSLHAEADRHLGRAVELAHRESRDPEFRAANPEAFSGTPTIAPTVEPGASSGPRTDPNSVQWALVQLNASRLLSARPMDRDGQFYGVSYHPEGKRVRGGFSATVSVEDMVMLAQLFDNQDGHAVGEWIKARVEEAGGIAAAKPVEVTNL